MAYIVTAPLIQARKADGSYVHIYEGGVLPDDVDDTHLEQLLAGKMVEVGPAAGGKPKASAKVADWRAYAVAQGMSEEDAAAASKDDLVELYADES